MTRFSKLELVDGKLVEINVREIPQSAIGRCPHVIFVADHYRPDGSCKCDDPSNSVMREWGYRWDEKLRKWR